MKITRIDHVAYITPDIEATIRFYRDLLGCPLDVTTGHDGLRHYFFKCGDSQIAFFAYSGARAMENPKFHGERTNSALGFDHMSLTVATVDDLFALRDRLDAASIPVHGPIDHGFIWSIYFFDPVTNLPLEASWTYMDLVNLPANSDADPVPAAREGMDPQPGHWPAVTRPTPPDQYIAKGGFGEINRRAFLDGGNARYTEEFLRRSLKTLSPAEFEARFPQYSQGARNARKAG